MPRVTRKTTLKASPEEVYQTISDPRRLPDWWPRVIRVEDVAGRPGAERTRWTNVLEADSGRKLRLDYRCVGATSPQRYAWEHELEGTPFEEHMNSQTTEVRLVPSRGGTEVRLTSEHGLKGSARLAGFMMRRSQREMLDKALSGLESIYP